jgi:hypothetical protein
MKLSLVFICALAAVAADNESPTGNRTTPPTVNSVSPRGVTRGATVELTVEGLNLAGASAIYFSQPGIQARIVRVKELPDLPDIRLGSNGGISTIDLGPLPPRNQVTVELDVSADAEVGPVDFRLQTPLGTSPAGRFLVEPYYGESPDREPNDTPDVAFETFTPTILVGTISKPGDVDYYKIKARAGEELTFENPSAELGSALAPVVSIYDASQNLLHEFGQKGGREEYAFSYRFEKAGAYFIRIGDANESGSARHFYRVKVGKFPLAVSAWPMGLRRGASAPVKFSGYNLGNAAMTVKGEASPEDERAVILRPNESFNTLKLGLSDDPEVEAAAGPMPVTLPVTVNGRLTASSQDFRFHARKGDKLVFEVTAARLGSQLDSLLEVLDAKGKPVERGTVRAVLETSITLRDHESAGSGLRILSPTGLAVGDTLMVGNEILQIEAMPRGPDDDMRFVAFGGQRLGLLDTTPEAHAIDTPVYKVQIHPAGAAFPPNGLPLVHLPYRNDDGGPGFGKDSLLRFTAPADGDYTLRLSDVRGLKGEEYAYRLSLRPPRPDFLLSMSPRNPNVPAGGRIPVTVTALRLDDFDGPIDVSVGGLPAGLSATTAAIQPGQTSTTLLLSAATGATLDRAAPLKVTGRARAGNREIVHDANPEDHLKLVALMPKPDIQMTAKTREITLEPGGTAEVAVEITRNNQFGGRVPVEVRNLPPGVLVLDVGLNGVLINEDENKRSFTLQALPVAEPGEQPIVLSGKIETRADAQQTSYASEPVVLRVRPKNVSAGSVVRSANTGPSARK